MDGDVLGDADDCLDPGVDRFVDRVGGEARKDEHERGVRSGLGDGLRDRAEDRDSLDVLAGLSGGDPATTRCRMTVAEPWNRPSLPVSPWTTRHVRGRRGSPSGGLAAEGDPLEGDVPVVDTVGKQAPDLGGLVAFAGRAPSQG